MGIKIIDYHGDGTLEISKNQKGDFEISVEDPENLREDNGYSGDFAHLIMHRSQIELLYNFLKREFEEDEDS